MLKKLKEIPRKYILIFAGFILIFSIAFITLRATYTEKTTSSIWDGSIATSFARGTGEIDNPYVIRTSEQFAYFFTLINGDNATDYFNKYYSLDNNINLNNLDFSFARFDKIFSGTFNGNGYTISNLRIEECNNHSNTHCIYSLFSNLNNATIKNLNINTATVDKEIANDSIVSFLAYSMENTTISDVTLNNLSAYLYGNKSTNVNGLTYLDNGGNNIFRLLVALDSNIPSGNILYGTKFDTTTIDYLIYRKNDNYNLFQDSTVALNNSYGYTGVGSEMTFDNELTLENILATMNINSEVTWDFKNNIIRLLNTGRDPMTLMASPSANNSGISGSTVYVNNYQSDYDYYMGLNYTSTTNEAFPTAQNKNLYSDNNLAYVQINYFGTDYTGDNVGYVSSTERQNKYVYYMVVPITKNVFNQDIVKFDLIDDPFADRPSNNVFNGWYSDDSNATIKLDTTTYTRYMEYNVTYSGSTPNNINVNVYAMWVKGKTATITGSWSSSVFAGFESAGFHSTMRQRRIGPNDMSAYYVVAGHVNRNSRYPYSANPTYYRSNGQAITNTNTNCTTYGGCDYYMHASGAWEDGVTYYTVRNNNMTTYTPTLTTITENDLNPGDEIGGFFELTTIPYGADRGLYYNTSTNQRNDDGVCNQSGGCGNAYRMLPAGTKAVANRTYYYNSTRDFNVINLTGNVTGVWDSSMNPNQAPFTVTDLNNGTQGTHTWTIQSNAANALICYSDTRIEQVKIQGSLQNTSNGISNALSSSSGEGFQLFVSDSDENGNGGLVGNFHNVKVGRGITQSGTYVNFANAIGGSLDNGGTAVKKYSFIVESGIYYTLSLTTQTNSYGDRSNTYRVDSYGIYGNDYDRVNNDNNKLTVGYSTAGSWGYTVYSSDQSYTKKAFKTTVKSGNYGRVYQHYTSGIYAGGRGGHETTINIIIFKYTYWSGALLEAPYDLIIEGGDINNIIGGPSSSGKNKNYNDTHIYFKGGTTDFIFGGSGKDDSYCNKVIQVTGGKVNYSVFGGSNGSTNETSTAFFISTEDSSITDGDTYIYVGGHAEIGDETLVNNNTRHAEYNVEAGSVFGATNGKSDDATIGAVDSSIIIVDGEALVRRNVYGGSNFGGAGIASGQNSTININILGDSVINGSVYGGGNNNGAGSTNYTDNITINQNGGTVNTAIYGGSNISGTIYGNVTINVVDGTANEVYGGGEGVNTFVRDNVDVVVGSSSTNPNIVNVYGGSAYGTVNATAANAAANNNHTNVTINSGTITGNVFGGAKGNASNTPHVKGNINVNVNGGTITRVYGGFDAAGTPERNVYVYLNGGVIGEAFGGGANTSINTSNIYLRGATVTDLYGGSNQSGTATTTNVNVESGTVSNIFGGNNVGGNCVTSNVNITGGAISTAVYGGGNEVNTTTTNVNLYNNEGTIPNVYGGGNKAGATTTNVKTLTRSGSNNVNVTNLFGGSYGYVNPSTSAVYGNVTDSYIEINTGTFENIYGGNDSAAKTTNSHITFNNGTVEDLFGGGNLAETDVTNVSINGGTATNAYGGGNLATVVTSNITTSGGNVTNGFGGGNQASVTTTNFNIVGGNITNAYGGGNQAGCTTANITTTEGGNGVVTNLFGGSNASGSIPNAYIIINSGTTDNVYGGNNQGGITTTPTIVMNSGVVNNIYGGGNNANVNVTDITVNGGTVTGSVYGGGNNAAVSTNSNVKILGGTINNNVFGGGNNGTISGDTNVIINNGNILHSAYAGGNGTTATVFGNTNIYVGGDSIIGTSDCVALSQCAVFGGGNAAYTGDPNSNSNATVNIDGGTIYGNVYGGANTSVVYGSTYVYIGSNANVVTGVDRDAILIKGTVFGGGEANASGSENYDYSFISVTRSILVDINGANYDNIDIEGSIFGSGNASSTTGTSRINIYNYGTYNAPKKNVSIQRTNKLVIDNSALILQGATDRTNEYSDVLFTLSIIDELDLQNNSTLYLETGANLLKSFKSLTADGEKAVVTIDSENGTMTRNVNNRLYMLSESGNILNIATNESVTSYGNVYGMTFFGMFKYRSDDTVNQGIYDDSAYGAELNWGGVFDCGTYVLGAHKTNHDIEADGFYSNYIDEDTSLNVIKYIEPTPEDSPLYMWVIGEMISEYNVDLVASKYSTLGTVELPFLGFSRENTSFQILGFDYSELDPSVSLIDKGDIPKLALDPNDADTVMGLSMEASNTGWLTSGSSSFYTDEVNPVSGVKYYVGSNDTAIPTMLFYLYHSKNLNSTGNMGTVKIVILATTKIDDLTYDNERLVVNVNLSRILYNTIDYEAALTPGRKYELFSSTLTNISSKSSISAYFSLFAEGNTTYKNGYHRALVSSYVLPENTKITMIDMSKEDEIKYYYHVINATDVANAQAQCLVDNEVDYDISLFEAMGALNSGVNYNDAAMNTAYYNSAYDVSNEEFIFIIDFEDANITSDLLNSSLLFELQDRNNETMVSVLGIQHGNMIYNVYANNDGLITVDGTISSDKIYSGEEFVLDLTSSYNDSATSGVVIYDTNMFEQKLGYKISLINSDGEVVSGTSLLGLYYLIDGTAYYPSIDGTTRVKIADKVGSTETWIRVVTGTSSIATGEYTLRIDAFGSSDGLYYGLNTSSHKDFPITIVNEIYGLNVSTDIRNVIIDKVTGYSKQENNRVTYVLEYNSGLTDPSIRLKLSRRTYDAIYEYTYVPVELTDYYSNEFTSTSVPYEYTILNNPTNNVNLVLDYKDNLQNGTYKLEFMLYDGTTRIGTVEKYVIIK